MTNAAALPYVCQATDTNADEWKSLSVLEVNGTFNRMKDRRHFLHATGMRVIAEKYAHGGSYYVKVVSQVEALEFNA